MSDPQYIFPMDIRMREVPNCILCGTPGISLYKDLEDNLCGVPGCFGFSKCPKCGLIWQNPQPIPEDILKCYVEVEYYTHKINASPITSNEASSHKSKFRKIKRRKFENSMFIY